MNYPTSVRLAPVDRRRLEVIRRHIMRQSPGIEPPSNASIIRWTLAAIVDGIESESESETKESAK